MHSNNDKPIIEIKGITKNYGSICALKGLDISIYKNECVGLVGDNGAGKSTLIKILSGILTHDKGTITIDGKEVHLNSYKDSSALGIETIYQDTALVDLMDVSRNVFLGREIHGPMGFLNEKKMDRLSMELLDSIGIKDITSPRRLIGTLSGGQKQSVTIARAVNFKSRILLLDEPTAALSVKETNFVNNFITNLKDEGISSIYVSHNIFEAYAVVDRFIILSHGSIVGKFNKEETTAQEIQDMILAN